MEALFSFRISLYFGSRRNPLFGTDCILELRLTVLIGIFGRLSKTHDYKCHNDGC